jgi:hypothetical protein
MDTTECADGDREPIKFSQDPHKRVVTIEGVEMSYEYLRLLVRDVWLAKMAQNSETSWDDFHKGLSDLIKDGRS